ncbi:MAG: translation elongation factor Ts, partial [Pirellulaceae bacterium]|nr:translation elongation factor Ts [Pirellulaceae bacterium]
MAEITAAAVKELRQMTGLPMMDCKKALQESGGDAEKAIELLRKSGAKLMEKRAGRSTTSGRIAIYIAPDGSRAGMVDLRCESAPVAANEEFVQLAADMARQLAEGPGAGSADELLDQPSPSGSGTLRRQFDDLVNRIREVFRVERFERFDGPVGGYAHHNAAAAVLLQYEGEAPGELAKDICMHVAALRPS